MSNAFWSLDSFGRAQIRGIANDFLFTIAVPKHLASYYYVGITNNVNVRKQQHDRDFKSSFIGQIQMTTKEGAKALEAYLIDDLGFKGDLGGGNSESVFVYVLDKSHPRFSKF